MSKIEVLSDRIEIEKSRVVVEIAIPMDFLREAVKNPETIKKAFAMGFADAMDDFMVKKQVQK